MASEEMKKIMIVVSIISLIYLTGCDERKNTPLNSEYNDLNEYLDVRILPDSGFVKIKPFSVYSLRSYYLSDISDTLRINEWYQQGLYYNTSFYKTSYSPILYKIWKVMDAFSHNELPEGKISYDNSVFISICDSSFMPKTQDILSVLYNYPNALKDTVEINNGNKKIFICVQSSYHIRAKYSFKLRGILMLTNQWISDLFIKKIGIVPMEHDFLALDGTSYVWCFNCNKWDFSDFELCLEGFEYFDYIYYSKNGTTQAVQ